MPHAGSVQERLGGCGVCRQSTAPYTCPRCRLRYCSVGCYREHGTCAGEFYRRNAESALKGETVDAEIRAGTAELLKRHHDEWEEAEADDGSAEALHRAKAQLEALDAEGVLTSEAAELVAADLPQPLRAGFHAAIKDDPRSLAAAAPPDAPMWWEEAGLRLTPGADPVNVHAAPPLPPPLPPLQSLLPPGSQPPPPAVAWGVVDVVCAYAACLRVYSGDWSCDPDSACELLIDVSPSLSVDVECAARDLPPPRPLHASPVDAATAVAERCGSVVEMRGAGCVFSARLAADAAALLSESSHLVRALHAAEYLIDGALSQRRGRQGRGLRRAAARVTKKLRFLQCWARAQDDGVLSIVACELKEHSKALAKEAGDEARGESAGTWRDIVRPPDQPCD